jgi:hypothetical protein
MTVGKLLPSAMTCDERVGIVPPEEGLEWEPALEKDVYAVEAWSWVAELS